MRRRLAGMLGAAVLATVGTTQIATAAPDPEEAGKHPADQADDRDDDDGWHETSSCGGYSPVAALGSDGPSQRDVDAGAS